MGYALAPWAGVAYAGAREIVGGQGGGIITDPSRPDISGYRWLQQPSSGGPWAGSVWGGGGGAFDQTASGGLLVTPDSDSAEVRIDAWWSGAPFLRLARIIDGEVTPVRGAYPAAIRTGTRRNRCTNPSFEAGTTGWVAGTNTTVTNPTAAALAGSRVGRFTATAAGAVNSQIPAAVLPTVPPVLSFGLRFPTAGPSGALTITATWVVGASVTDGTPITTTTSVTVPSATLAGYVGATMQRLQPLTVPLPSAPGVLSGSLALSVAGLAAGGVMEIDAVQIDETGGDYFDGSGLLATWAGTPHLSESTLAATQQITDREAPLDVPISYVLTAPDQPAFRAVAEPVVLESKRRIWLQHPWRGRPMQVTVNAEPKQTYDIEQTEIKVIGRKRPVVVSAARRQSAKGTYSIATERFADRDQLLDLLDDGSPLLLRMPADHGHGPGEWVSIGSVDVETKTHRAREGTRWFTLPFTVVDPPALPDAAAA